MPLIVGVHGIAQQYAGGFALATQWFDAVRDGLAAAGKRPRALALTALDMRVAFFGDLFRPFGSMGEDPPYAYLDVAAGPERDLLAIWYGGAVDLDPSLAPGSDAMAPVPVPVQVMLDRLLRFKGFAGVSERAFIGSLKQVSRFLTDQNVKDGVLTRFGDELGPDTAVVLGHSLGSVVAYEYLCRYRPTSVRLLVTMGSPLGIRNIVFDRLTPRPENGAGAWPGALRSWVNVADRNDVVALRKRLGGMFPAPSGGEGVDDQRVDNGWSAHAADRYLNTSAVGDAIAACLAG